MELRRTEIGRRRLRLVGLSWILAAGAFFIAARAPAVAEDVSIGECLPAVEDYTFMWWAHGWRERSPEGTRVLAFQSGRFGMVLDVDRLELTNLGPLASGKPYRQAASDSNDRVFNLPEANLGLEAVVDGRTYRACRGKAPGRIVESGRFFQRWYLEGLVFQDEEARPLEATGRLEVSIWPDRAGFVLELTPAAKLGPAQLAVRLTASEGSVPASGRQAPAEWPPGQTQTAWLVWTPDGADNEGPPEKITAVGVGDNGQEIPVTLDPARGWCRVELPNPAWDPGVDLDHLERVRLKLKNPGKRPRVFRLLLAKDYSFPGITGMSPMLRDSEGNPTGIPVQISKNWHRQADERMRLEGPWFHGFTVLRIPPESATECEFSLAYGRWGGVPAASHAQLCLIGYGGDQVWDQAAIGSWGESICYDPDVNLQRSMIDDVRPLMVWAIQSDRGKWNWTNNVGGGDFLVYFDASGRKQFLSRVRTAYTSQCPNLTEVTYSGITPDGAIAAEITVSTPRVDDYNRAFHRFRYRVLKPTRFTRLAFYQLGADHYNGAPVAEIAWGNVPGMIDRWEPSPADEQGEGYARSGILCEGTSPWFSLKHKGHYDEKGGAYANRGLVVRRWKARLGGRDVPQPFAAVFRTPREEGRLNVELTPPPDLKELLPGDFVEAEVHMIVMPIAADDYYGPNRNLKAALAAHAEPWKRIHREAAGNDLRVEAARGNVLHRYPIVVQVDAEQGADVAVTGGVGYVPVTFTGLNDYRGWRLLESAGGPSVAVDQSVHGNDYWQTDHDAPSGTWRITFNVSLDSPDDEPRTTRLVLERP